MIERIIVGPLFTNAYVVSIGKKECIVIDPGAEGEKIRSRLEVLNVAPKAIIATHGHIDHTGAINHILDAYDADIPVCIHEADAAFFAESAAQTNRETFAQFGDQGTEVLDELFNETPKPTVFLKHGDTILDSDLQVLCTPGHTPGGISLYSEERGVVFSGDTLFFKGIGRTDIPGGDAGRLRDSIEKVLFELPPETRLFPGHGPNSTIERERKNNPLVSDGQPI